MTSFKSKMFNFLLRNRYLFFCILLCTTITACAKDKNMKPPTGILIESPKITVSANTQFSLNYNAILSKSIDTSLVFKSNVVDSLQRSFDVVRRKGNYKGLSVAIGIPDVGFWSYAGGESGTKIPLSVSTKFHALSVGKIFTSALLLKLIEDGSLSMNMTIDRWFPDFPRANEITIYHLLTHTSGIQTYEALKEFSNNKFNAYLPTDLVKMASVYPIANQPNTYQSYTNTGYVMLGIIIEKTTGITLEQAFHQYFIKPLNLANTVYCGKGNTSMIDVKGYHNNTISNQNQWPLAFAAGPFIATPTDLILLYNYVLSGKFISQTSITIMLSEMNLWKLNPNVYYGKGIYLIKDLPSGNYLGHSGGYDCFRTCVFYNIEKNIFVSLMSNTDDFEIEPAMFYFTEKIIKLLR